MDGINEKVPDELEKEVKSLNYKHVSKQDILLKGQLAYKLGKELVKRTLENIGVDDNYNHSSTLDALAQTEGTKSSIANRT